jgi:hypothetical protein
VVDRCCSNGSRFFDFFPQPVNRWGPLAYLRHRTDSTSVHGGTRRQIHVTKPPFAWDCLEDSPSLATIRKLLEAVPDAKLLQWLRRHRGKGRDAFNIAPTMT